MHVFKRYRCRDCGNFFKNRKGTIPASMGWKGDKKILCAKCKKKKRRKQLKKQHKRKKRAC